MFCNISQQIPKDPVVSLKSGLLFDKSLILKYISETGICPITKEPLTEQDLLPVKSNFLEKPKPLSGNSIPDLINLFHDEWETSALESFQLKQQIQMLRQELSHSLYQHDAACRVIARLIKERDEAKAQISQEISKTSSEISSETANHNKAHQVSLSTVNSDNTTAIQPGDTPLTTATAKTILPEEMIKHIEATGIQLSEKRKAQQLSRQQLTEHLSSVEKLRSFKPMKPCPLHKAKPAGINSIEIQQDRNLILTGGQDHHAIVSSGVSSSDSGSTVSVKVLATLSGHSKAVTCAVFHPTENNVILTSSVDKTSKVWVDQASTEAGAGSSSGNFNYQLKQTFSGGHSDVITATSIHPGGRFFVTSSLDRNLCYWDIGSGKTLHQSTMAYPLTTVQFHPDGMLLAFAGQETNNVVSLLDVTSGDIAETFAFHKDTVSTLSFSENGYHLASGSKDGTVRLYDLRKSKNFHTIDIGHPVSCVRFDTSGTYLAIASDCLQTYQVKVWNELMKFSSENVELTAVAFAKDAQYLAVATKDKNLRIYK